MGDALRRDAAERLKDTLVKFLKASGRDYKFSFKDSDKAPVRKYQELDIKQTLKDSGNAREVTDALKEFRSTGTQTSESDLRSVNNRLNNIDNVQRSRLRLTPRPKRACTI